MEKIEALCQTIENSIQDYSEELKESVEVYSFLKKEFMKGDISNNRVFQFMFRSFYRLDNAGLTPEFKTKYFEVMEEIRNSGGVQYKEIILKADERLKGIKNIKKQENLQFSFITKLAHTIDNTKPIYDSEIARVLELARPYYPDREQRLEKFLEQISYIEQIYQYIIQQGLLAKTNTKFRNFFSDKNLSDAKILDFVFWQAGKSLKSQAVM